MYGQSSVLTVHYIFHIPITKLSRKSYTPEFELSNIPWQVGEFGHLKKLLNKCINIRESWKGRVIINWTLMQPKSVLLNTKHVKECINLRSIHALCSSKRDCLTFTQTDLLVAFHESRIPVPGSVILYSKLKSHLFIMISAHIQSTW